MPPQGIQVHLLTLAEVVALLLASKLTPERVRQVLLRLTGELKEVLPEDGRRDTEAAEAKAVIKAIAYSDLED